MRRVVGWPSIWMLVTTEVQRVRTRPPVCSLAFVCVNPGFQYKLQASFTEADAGAGAGLHTHASANVCTSLGIHVSPAPLQACGHRWIP